MRVLAFMFFLLAAAPAALAQTFPALTGHVVDGAQILKPESLAALEAKLKSHEDKTTDQVVVATIASLEGFAVEDYANRLFRHWKLGQKGKDNGILLLVAPHDRKVRIEVGYGLEGTLTDTLSSVIITSAITPQFKKGDFPAGIGAGADAITSILTGDAAEWQERAKVRTEKLTYWDWAIGCVILILILWLVDKIGKGIMWVFKHAAKGPARPSGSSSSRYDSSSGRSSSSRSSSTTYSGGGGSSGGGGASGSW